MAFEFCIGFLPFAGLIRLAGCPALMQQRRACPGKGVSHIPQGLWDG